MKKARAEKALPKNGPTKRVGSGRLVSWPGRTPEPEPLDECDVQLAIKIAEIHKQYGSLSAFFAHIEKEERKRKRALCAEQNRRIAAAWRRAS